MNPSAMSPNGNTNTQSTANKNVLQSADDNRRKPRPIGIERASWKHNVNIGINSNLDNVDNMNQHSIPPWIGRLSISSTTKICSKKKREKHGKKIVSFIKHLQTNRRRSNHSHNNLNTFQMVRC